MAELTQQPSCGWTMYMHTKHFVGKAQKVRIRSQHRDRAMCDPGEGQLSAFLVTAAALLVYDFISFSHLDTETFAHFSFQKFPEILSPSSC